MFFYVNHVFMCEGTVGGNRVFAVVDPVVLSFLLNMITLVVSPVVVWGIAQCPLASCGNHILLVLFLIKETLENYLAGDYSSPQLYLLEDGGVLYLFS